MKEQALNLLNLLVLKRISLPALVILSVALGLLTALVLPIKVR